MRIRRTIPRNHGGSGHFGVNLLPFSRAFRLSPLQTMASATVTPVAPSRAHTATEATLGEPGSGATAPTICASTKGEHIFELKDINVFFPPGQLTLVTGPTAAGKTALLRALLGEMYTIPSALASSATPSGVELQ